MCIIAVCKRPLTFLEFDSCQRNNSDGWGMSWFNDVDDKTIACVEKGYDCSRKEYGTYMSICKTVEKSYAQRMLMDSEIKHPLHVIHFRLTSVGVSCGALTHPFPLDKDLLDLDLMIYRTHKPLLFHNGHFDLWQSVMINLAIQYGMLDGEISDSKILAWALSYMSIEDAGKLLEALSDKFVLFDPTTRSAKLFGHFFKSDDDLVEFSNMSFRRTVRVVTA